MRSGSPSPSPTFILSARTLLADLHFGSRLLQWAPQRFYFPVLWWDLQKGEEGEEGRLPGRLSEWQEAETPWRNAHGQVQRSSSE